MHSVDGAVRGEAHTLLAGEDDKAFARLLANSLQLSATNAPSSDLLRFAGVRANNASFYNRSRVLL